MRNDFISINVVMDASGSMAPLRNDTIKGFNGFLDEQRSVPGDAVLTLCVFNSRSQLLFESKPIKDVSNLTGKDYNPTGGTALLDAIGKTITSTEKKILSMKEEERPSKVLFMILTDGEENSSSKFKIETIKEMIVKHQQLDDFPWEFIFIGASSVDAFSVSDSIGIASANAICYEATNRGTAVLLESVTKGVTNYRETSENFNVAYVQNSINKS